LEFAWYGEWWHDRFFHLNAGMDVKGVVAALQKDLEMPMIPEVGISHF
jgi:hypothetical protein